MRVVVMIWGIRIHWLRSRVTASQKPRGKCMCKDCRFTEVMRQNLIMKDESFALPHPRLTGIHSIALQCIRGLKGQGSRQHVPLPRKTSTSEYRRRGRGTIYRYPQVLKLGARLHPITLSFAGNGEEPPAKWKPALQSSRKDYLFDRKKALVVALQPVGSADGAKLSQRSCRKGGPGREARPGSLKNKDGSSPDDHLCSMSSSTTRPTPRISTV